MSTKQRILYIGNKQAARGKTPTSIDTLGKLLEQEGHTLYYSSQYQNKLLRLLHMWYSIWTLRKKTDIVLIDTYSTAAFYFAWSSARLCTLLGVKYVPILHGGNLPVRFKQNPKLCQQLFANSTANVCVSGYLLKHLEQHGFKGTLIQNSIHLSDYTYQQRTVLKPRLLWVRAFHHTYHPEMAIEVLNILFKSYPDANLTMVGPELDHSLTRCKALVSEYGLSNSVSFTGKLSKQEWTSLSADHDVFINTSRFDNQPVSILEAMALGLPVVSTDVGGISHMIQNGQNGFLVTNENPAAMADIIVSILKNPSVATTATAAAHKYVQQHDWQFVRHKWNELFNSITR